MVKNVNNFLEFYLSKHLICCQLFSIDFLVCLGYNVVNEWFEKNKSDVVILAVWSF